MTFQHEALLYQGIDDFVLACAPMLERAIDDGAAVLVATTAERIVRLRDAVGDHVDLDFVDMTALGRNPGRILPKWREFVSENAGRPLFGIGEPVWPGRSPSELTECHRHEALINLALAEADMRLVCPYDMSALDEDELAAAERTHPHVVEHGRHRWSGSYRGIEVLDMDGQLSAPALDATTIVFGPGDLATTRHQVAASDVMNGLPSALVDDVVLCTSELVANAIEHGAGRGVVRVWSDDDAVVCEVSDRGRIADPLVGRERPDLGRGRGRGIWMVNQICDLVELRSSAAGTVVRFHVNTPQ